MATKLKKAMARPATKNAPNQPYTGPPIALPTVSKPGGIRKAIAPPDVSKTLPIMKTPPAASAPTAANLRGRNSTQAQWNALHTGETTAQNKASYAKQVAPGQKRSKVSKAMRRKAKRGSTMPVPTYQAQSPVTTPSGQVIQPY